MHFSLFQMNFQFNWKCPKNIHLFGYLRGTLVVSKVLGSFLLIRKYQLSCRESYRKFEDTEKPYFHQKILGEVFLHTCGNRNFAKMLGDINLPGAMETGSASIIFFNNFLIFSCLIACLLCCLSVSWLGNCLEVDADRITILLPPPPPPYLVPTHSSLFNASDSYL